jgi:TusA-related sulfurtransferase
MSETVDARGLSCPQPVLDTLGRIAAMGKGDLLVLVDTEASMENVTRAVRAKGWDVVETVERDGEYHMRLAKE